MKRIKVNIGNEPIELNVEGETFFGKDEILLLQDDDLTEKANWHNQGYTVAPFLSSSLFEALKKGITKIVQQFIEKELGTPLNDFTLNKYHEFCESDELHLAVVRNFQQCLPIDSLPINYKLVEKRISEICNQQVSTIRPEKNQPSLFCIRIVRPQRETDNNPPHRDVWIDRLRNAINIYLPLAGSNQYSSLPIIPGSHLWQESSIERTAFGSKVNGIPFTVPCVVASTFGLNMLRPDINPNEVMVFSPYLIHGGGRNLNQDETRVSIEIRFWRDDINKHL